MSGTDSGRGSPRAVVHRRILDVAASSPDASMEAIADEVPAATTDLVERVFDEYGDPAAEQTGAAETAAASTPDQSAAASTPDQSATDQTETTTMQENGEHTTGEATAAGIDPSSLTDRQRETLRLVHDHPGWTQADVADHLGVSRATVSRRLNDIPGFEWADRASFTGQVFADEPGTAPDVASDGDADSDGVADSTVADATTPGGDGADGGPVAGNGGSVAVTDSEGAVSDVEDAVATLDDRLDGIETAIEDLGGETAEGQSISIPPELARKVLHACMHSDRISEDEELRLIEALLGE